MEISILLTIFLIVVWFDGPFLLGGKGRLMIKVQINDFVTIKYNPKNVFYIGAVKLTAEDFIR